MYKLIFEFVNIYKWNILLKEYKNFLKYLNMYNYV